MIFITKIWILYTEVSGQLYKIHWIQIIQFFYRMHSKNMGNKKE